MWENSARKSENVWEDEKRQNVYNSKMENEHHHLNMVLFFYFLKHLWRRGRWRGRGRRWWLAYLMVKFRQLHFYFLPLEEMILCLLTYWGNQIKLSSHRICLLKREREKEREEVDGCFLSINCVKHLGCFCENKRKTKRKMNKSNEGRV